METVLNLLLIRFGVIALVVVVIALVLFAVALRLRRRGRWEETRDRVVSRAAPIVRDLVDQRTAGRRDSAAGRVGRSMIGYAVDRATRTSADSGEGEQQRRDR